MRPQLILLLACVLIFSASCKKKPALSAATAKVKTVALTGTTPNETTTMTYGPDGKLIRAQGSLNDYITYTYASGMVTVSTYDTSGTLTETDTYFLNSGGLADSAVITLPGGGPYLYETFVYDANGYKIRENIYDNTMALMNVYAWTIANGNAVMYLIYDNASNVIQTQTTVYTNNLNSAGNQQSGLSFYGNTSTDLPASANVTGNTIASYTYTYTFDSNGLLLTETSTGTGPTLTWTYTYY